MPQQILNYLSAGAAVVAAGLWFLSSVATVESDYKGDLGNEPGVKISWGDWNPIKLLKNGRRIDIVRSLDRQGKLNSCAAFAAGVAAILQAIALGFPYA